MPGDPLGPGRPWIPWDPWSPGVPSAPEDPRSPGRPVLPGGPEGNRTTGTPKASETRGAWRSNVAVGTLGANRANGATVAALTWRLGKNQGRTRNVKSLIFPDYYWTLIFVALHLSFYSPLGPGGRSNRKKSKEKLLYFFINSPNSPDVHFIWLMPVLDRSSESHESPEISGTQSLADSKICPAHLSKNNNMKWMIIEKLCIDITSICD